MKKKNIRSRLTLITSTIILSFLIISSGLFYLFLTYFAQIIERVYGIDDDILQPFFSIIAIALFLLIVFALVASILGGFFVSEHFLNNVVKFTQQIKRIKHEGLDKRIPIVNNDELDDLGKEFNYLMDDIEASIQKQNQFVSDASHELKTPLAIINGNIDMLKRWGKDDPKILDESLDVISSEVNRMITLTGELLQLTKEFEIDELPRLSVQGIIERIVNQYEKLYPDFVIQYDYNDELQVNMKTEHFEQILMILLDNAVKYSRVDSKRIEITHSNNVLIIKDYGIGIEQAETNKIFDRLYRVDESRENNKNSFGLGLSILKRISEWYKFTIEVESIKDEYTSFILKFEGGKENE